MKKECIVCAELIDTRVEAYYEREGQGIWHTKHGAVSRPGDK